MRTHPRELLTRGLLSVVLLVVTASSYAFEFPHIVHQDGIKFELFPRSAEQIASFYEARGFPKAMIDEVTSHCFITVRIHNQRDSKLWLDISRWKFSNDAGEIKRHHRNELLDSLKQANYPAPSIATFRWTLLPESLDYLPDEQESGNVLIDRVAGKISIEAAFDTGNDRSGKPVMIHYQELECAQ